MAGRDQLGDADLVGDIVEDLAQPLFVATIGCGSDAEDLGRRVALQGVIDDAPVAVGHRVMRLINDEEIERRHVGKVRGA